MRVSRQGCTFISEGICTFCAEAIEDAAASVETASARLGAMLDFGAAVPPVSETAELDAAVLFPKPPKLKAVPLDAAALEATTWQERD